MLSDQSTESTRLSETRSRAKARARQEAQRQADVAKEELGRMAFDALEEYFPEQAKSRRRSDRMRILVAGIAIGILLRHLASR
jgi:hypothetical protein